MNIHLADPSFALQITLPAQDKLIVHEGDQLGFTWSEGGVLSYGDGETENYCYGDPGVQAVGNTFALYETIDEEYSFNVPFD